MIEEQREKKERRYQNLEGVAQLSAFLGAHGYRTRTIESEDELVEVAAAVYEIPEDDKARVSVKAMAARIAGMSKAQRRALARKNIQVADPEGVEAADAVAISTDGQDGQVQAREDPARLLRQVVSAVISSGHGDILNDLPDVLAYFGARLPTAAEVIGLGEIDHIEGGITLDDRVHKFACSRRTK